MRDKNLERAHQQALDYFPGLKDRDPPRYVLVSDFARFRLYDLDADSGAPPHIEFKLAELPKSIKHFALIAGYTPQTVREQDPVNIKAAERMGRLHDQLKAAGFGGHALEVLLVRLLFCLFADDTGIFELQGFREWLERRTAQDGSELGPRVAELFQVLDTPRDKRQHDLDEQLAAFEYVNGRLFEETLPIAAFDGRSASHCSTVARSTGARSAPRSSVRCSLQSWIRRRGATWARPAPASRTSSS